VLYASGETLVFVRLYQQEQVLVALQRDGSGQAQLPHNPLLARGPWRRVEGRGELSETAGGLRLQLAEESATVWRCEG
ncbi:TPA: maltodextrin glucosidase, partial [Serratia marcescens]